MDRISGWKADPEIGQRNLALLRSLPMDSVCVLVAWEGLDADPFEIKVFKEASVDDLKHLIYLEVGLKPFQQTLLFADAELQDSSSLKECGVEDGSLLMLTRKGGDVVTSSLDSTAKIWNSITGACVQTLEGHRGPVMFAAFSPDGAQVVTASWDGTAKLWNASTGECNHTFAGHDQGLLNAMFSPNGLWLLTSSDDRTSKLWDITKECCINSFAGSPAVFSPDGKTVAAASWDIAMILSTFTGEKYSTFVGHESNVTSVAYSNNGVMLVTASVDATAKMWNAKTGQCLRTLVGHTHSLVSANFGPGGKLIITTSLDTTAKVWDYDFAEECVHTLAGHRGALTSATFSPSGSSVLTASDDATVMLWTASDGVRIAHVFMEHLDAVKSAVFSADEAAVLTASSDGTAKIWDASTGMCLHTFSGHTKSLTSAAYAQV